MVHGKRTKRVMSHTTVHRVAGNLLSTPMLVDRTVLPCEVSVASLQPVFSCSDATCCLTLT